MILHGLDVSHHQGRPDWRRVFADGIGFTLVKATEGLDFTDAEYTRNVRAALAAGVPTAAYHFLHPGGAAGQADRFVHEVGRLSGWDGVGVMLDVETTGQGTTPRVGDVAGFLAEVRRLLGGSRTELLYTGRWYWGEVLGNPDMRRLGVALVESRYVPGAGPAPWRTLAAAMPGSWFDDARCGGMRPAVVQYAGTRGQVAGIAGPCDLDAYPGTADELRALMLGGGTRTQTRDEDDDMVIVTAPGRPWLAYYPTSGAARVIGPLEQGPLQAVHAAAGDKPIRCDLPVADFDRLLAHLDRGVRGQVPGLAQVAGQVAGLTTAVTRIAAGSGADAGALAAEVEAAANRGTAAALHQALSAGAEATA